jgi:hypothetical protein
VVADIYDYGDTLLDNQTFITELGDTLVTNQTFLDSITNIITTSETVTAFAQNTATGVITYTDEDLDTWEANVVSTDTDNAIIVGANGGAYLDSTAFNLSEVMATVLGGNQVAIHDDGAGNLTDIYETVTSLTLDATKDTLLYTDENNVLNKISVAQAAPGYSASEYLTGKSWLGADVYEVVATVTLGSPSTLLNLSATPVAAATKILNLRVVAPNGGIYHSNSFNYSTDIAVVGSATMATTLPVATYDVIVEYTK